MDKISVSLRIFFATAVCYSVALLAGDISSVSAEQGYLSLSELRAKYSNAGDKYADIDGVTVHYRDEGEGPAVILIHGSSSSLRSFDAVAEKLKSDYRVIRYDVPPTGLSGPVSDDALRNMQPTYIPAKLMENLGISKVNVAGVSYGGTIALFLAADYPDLVERVIVSCAPSDPIDLSVVDFGPSLTMALEEYGAYGDSSAVKPLEYWRTYFNFYAGQPSRINEETINLTFDFARRAPEQNATGFISQVADQEEAIKKWGAVRAPTLLLWGGSDALLPPSSAANLASYLVQSQVSTIILPDVGHYPPIEVPEQFADFVDTYIKSISAVGLGGTPPPHLR